MPGQTSTLFNVACLSLAITPNFAWLFYSKFLDTYLYYQIGEGPPGQEQLPYLPTEMYLFFGTTLAATLFTPLAALMYARCPLKVLICFACTLLLSGSIGFIMSQNLWTFVASQIIFSALGTSIVHLVSFMLAWEWFSPERRGVITGTVISF